MSADTIACGLRFVRNFVGGPFAGIVVMVGASSRAIVVTDRGITLGRYVLSNLGWTWHT